MNRPPRIVITGHGLVCGAGLTVDAVWDAIQNGRSAVAPIEGWANERWPIHIAGEVRGVSNQILVEDRKLHKIISRTDFFGIYAAGQAIRNSGLIAHRDALDPRAAIHFNDRSGIIVGSGGGAYRSNYDFFPLMTAASGDWQKFGGELGSTVNPMWLLKNLPNNVLCHVGIKHGFKGTNTCITNHCVSGALAVAEAAAALQTGEADRMVAVGHDAAVEPETILNYHQLGLLTGDALRSFDRDRAGTVLGEGAAAVVMESLTTAQARQAAVLGEVLGAGCATEACGVIELRPDGDGVARAIELALDDAKVAPREVGLLVAHGNGTGASDASEAAGIRRVFAGDLPPVTAFKWAFGHTIAASGLIDLVLALAALRQGVVPGIGTLNTTDPELGFMPISRTQQKPRSDIAVVVCRGFGGMNVALVVRAAPI